MLHPNELSLLLRGRSFIALVVMLLSVALISQEFRIHSFES
ncbi:unnamed protein product [Rhodiola kirilowii]